MLALVPDTLRAVAFVAAMTGPPSATAPGWMEPTSAVCAAETSEDPFLARVREAMDAADPDEAKRALSALQREAAADTVAAGMAGDVSAQYRLAAVIGARSLVEGGLTRVRLAAEFARQADRVLALAPDHPGAHFMMGRLHAGVMRLDRATRFLATRLLGGAALKGASWDAARAHLEAAARGQPCEPEHHLELARLYAEIGEEEGARLEAEAFMELTGPDASRWTPARQRLVERMLAAS